MRHRIPTSLLAAPCAILAIMLGGCASLDREDPDYREQRNRLQSTEPPATTKTGPAEADAAHDHPADDLLPALLAGPTLDRTAVVQAVLQRNPGIAAAREGWRAALARYPQQTAWEDPMVSYRSYPLSIGAANTHYGQEIEVSQRIPIGSKLDLQGEITLAEAEAAASDFQAVRIRLSMMASQFYDDYAVAVRCQAIITHHLDLIAEMKADAQAHVANGTASVQDPYQADAEAADLQQDLVGLAADRDVAIAQLNGLLHRLPIDGALPTPTDEALAAPAMDADALQEVAIRERPELAQERAKARRADTSLALAEQQYRPDVTVSGSYSSLWDQRDYRFALGASVALPIHTDRLRGGVEEAQAQITQAHLEREHMERDIRVEVVEAARRLSAAESSAAVIHDQLLPALNNRLDAVRTAFAANRESLATVIDATRALRSADVRYQQALAEVSRRRAALIASIGRLPVPVQPSPQPGATP